MSRQSSHSSDFQPSVDFHGLLLKRPQGADQAAGDLRRHLTPELRFLMVLLFVGVHGVFGSTSVFPILWASD